MLVPSGVDDRAIASHFQTPTNLEPQTWPPESSRLEQLPCKVLRDHLTMQARVDNANADAAVVGMQDIGSV